jgi:pimeloyl-ACP methyl ester carboxylesterase
MYCEIRGTCQLVVVPYGAYITIDLMGEIALELAKTRQVMAVERQGHEHTAEVDRPLAYEQMVDDTAALLRHLQFAGADAFGYSMGGGASRGSARSGTQT